MASRSSTPRRSSTRAGSTYATISAKLYCLDAKTGNDSGTSSTARTPRARRCWADGKIYIAEVDSHFHILKPKDENCEELCDVFFEARRRAPRLR